MQNFTSKKIFQITFLFGVFLLAVSLPWSKFLMSVAQIILFTSWIVDGNIISKLRTFWKNKPAVFISSVFVLHIVGLSYTSDLSYGLDDVKRKIPLMLLPLVFSTSPQLSKNIFEKLLALFIASVVAASLVCSYIIFGFSEKKILQPQEASIFISHIRFGLLISMAVFSLGYFVATNRTFALKAVYAAAIIWLLVFLVMLESLTGLLSTLLISAAIIAYRVLKSKSALFKIGFAAAFIFGVVIVVNYMIRLNESVSTYSAIDLKLLPSTTKNGNPYTHDTLSKEVENGSPVWINFCEQELSEEWNKISELNYSGKDLRGNEIKYTLVRFLASKGLNKDAEGVRSLTAEEIQAIEAGIANVNYIGVFNPSARIQKILWELNNYVRGGNPSGHSVAQRIEFWKAALGIIKENPFIGVGTGDTFNEFRNYYDKTNSVLAMEWRLRSHNQVLAIGTAFGITGALWFLFALFYPLLDKKNLNYFYLTFFILALLSMLTEDTLETQAGVTFFSFFNSLFLFLYKKD